MSRLASLRGRESGFTLVEFTVVLVGSLILLAASVPVLSTTWNQYRLILAAQSIVSQLQYARMKSVASNESFRVNFPIGQRTYQVQSSNGSVVAGPFYLPTGITWNSTDPGSEVSFPGRYVSFLPSGTIPVTGNGSAGRVKILNQSGLRVDIVVASGGIIRQTSPYAAPPAPF